jgi:hypothetical protein
MSTMTEINKQTKHCARITLAHDGTYLLANAHLLSLPRNEAFQARWDFFLLENKQSEIQPAPVPSGCRRDIPH